VFNTALISAAGTAGNVVVSSLCAYPLAKRRFPGSRLLFGVIVTALMFNPAVTAIPNYFILSKIRLVDSYWAIILPAVAMPLGLYLMKQFMEQMVPDSLIEAAKIDGAPERVIFWKLIMPIVKPAWLTLILFSFQSLWAVSNTPLLRSEELKTMQYALLTLKDSGLTRAGAYSAGAFLMLLVPVSIFLVTQSNILETMATSGMKD
jgi:ABC-type glycerol-3-phosphate transport system permease component